MATTDEKPSGCLSQCGEVLSARVTLTDRDN